MFFVFDLQGNLHDVAGKSIVKHQFHPDEWMVRLVQDNSVTLFKGTLHQCQSYQNVLHGELVKAGRATLVFPTNDQYFGDQE